MAGASGVSEHAASGPGLIRSSPFGRLLVPVLVFMILRICAAILGLSNPMVWAIVGAVAFEVVWFVLRRRLAQRRTANAIAEQSQQDTDKEIEFKRRYEEAQRNGDFDKFNVTNDR